MLLTGYVRLDYMVVPCARGAEAETTRRQMSVPRREGAVAAGTGIVRQDMLTKLLQILADNVVRCW